MGGYIGSNIGTIANAAERKQTYSITTATTSLTGLAYTPTKVHVFHNGVRLVDGTDYTATNGTSITLTNAAQNGDEVVVISYPSFQTSDTVSAANGGTFAGNVTMSGTLDVTGNSTVGGTLTTSGAFTSLGIDDNATSTAMTLDSSQNLLVGTTSASIFNASSGTGMVYRNGIALDVAREASASGQPCINLNMTGTDGDHIIFYKDGTSVGSISNSSTNLIVEATGSGRSGLNFGGSITPRRNAADSDNQVDLGASSLRFDDIFATNGTIQTSDRNEKQDIEDLSEAELRVATAAKGLIKKYRWIDAVQKKGDDARIHVGIIAQDLQAAFEAEGLDAGRYAMFISDTWTDEETGEERTRLGVRYPELLAFIIGAL